MNVCARERENGQMCVCVYVCDLERKRERGRGRGRERERERGNWDKWIFVSQMFRWCKAKALNVTITFLRLNFFVHV